MDSNPTAHAIDRVMSVALKPWAITPEMLGVVARILGHRLAANPLDVSALERRPKTEIAADGGVAIIPIHGVLAPRMNALSEISGGTSYDRAGKHLAMAMRNPEVATIILDVDSPGGSVQGCGELARALLSARQSKTIIAHANFEMASAAWWLGACCSEVCAAPSAFVGSQGVYTIHEDLSKALDQLGVKTTYIAAGKYKVEGNETEPLSAEALAHRKALVDQVYGRFVADVAEGRGKSVGAVTESFGEGRILSATDAHALGMVDHIETLDETVARVLPSGTRLSRMDAEAPQLPAPPAPPVDLAAQVRQTQRALLALGFTT
jgi:signal peptide peptidase SppA